MKSSRSTRMAGPRSMSACYCSRLYVSAVWRLLLTLAVLGVILPWKCAGLNIHSWAHLKPLNPKQGSNGKLLIRDNGQHYQNKNTAAEHDWSRGEVVARSPSKVLPQPMSEARVFVVGLPKAGTTTLHKLFKKQFAKHSHLTGTSCHWQYTTDKGVSVPVGKAIYTAHERNLPLLEYAPGCRYVAQMDYLKCSDSNEQTNCPYSYWPQITLLRELDYQYPGSKFILNTRPLQDHINSIGHWGNLRERLVDSDIPGLPPGKGGTDAELGKWIEDHNQGVRDYFRGRSQDFLEMKLGETSPFEVCQFLKGFTKYSKCLKHGEMPHGKPGEFDHSDNNQL